MAALRGFVLAVALVVLAAGSVSATVGAGSSVGHGSDVGGFDTFSAVNILPLDGTNRESPVNFVCSFESNSSAFANMTLSVFNSSGGVYYSAVNASEVGNRSAFYGVSLVDGNYSWGCRVCDAVECVSSVNFSLGINTVSVDAGDNLGDCITDRGYSFGFSVDEEEYVLLDLSALGSYLYNSSMPNVWAQNNPSILYAANELVIDTRVNKSVVVWIGGYSTNIPHEVDTPALDLTLTLSAANFTRENPCYWVRVKDEHSDDFWDYSDSVNHTLDIYCDNYAADRWDLKNTINRTTILVCTKENPLFHGILSSVVGNDSIKFNRVFETYSSSEDVRLYFLGNDSATVNKDFVLEDYTGHFGGSYLQVLRKVNETLRVIYQKRWYHLRIPDVSLENDSFFQYFVYTPTDSRVIAWDRVLDSDDVTISIREPLIGDRMNWYDGISFGFSASRSGSDEYLSLIYNISDGGISNVSFSSYFYNSSSGEYEGIETTTISSPTGNGVITHTVPAAIISLLGENKTYYLKCRAWNTLKGRYVELSEFEGVRVTANNPPYYDSGGIPDNWLGLSKDEIYTGVSIFLITLVAAMWGAINVGTGGIMTAFAVGVTYHFGWFREMSFPVVAFLFVMSVIYKLSEDRRPVE